MGIQVSTKSLNQRHGGCVMALAFPTPSLPPWPLGRVISFLKLKIHFVLCIIDGMSLWRPGRRQVGRMFFRAQKIPQN